MNPFLEGFTDELVKVGAASMKPQLQGKIKLPKTPKPKDGSYLGPPKAGKTTKPKKLRLKTK